MQGLPNTCDRNVGSLLMDLTNVRSSLSWVGLVLSLPGAQMVRRELEEEARAADAV
jgi:hypothetical protein